MSDTEAHDLVGRIARRLVAESPTQPDTYVLGNLNRILLEELQGAQTEREAWHAMMNEKGYLREIERLHGASCRRFGTSAGTVTPRSNLTLACAGSVGLVTAVADPLTDEQVAAAVLRLRRELDDAAGEWPDVQRADLEVVLQALRDTARERDHYRRNCEDKYDYHGGRP